MYYGRNQANATQSLLTISMWVVGWIYIHMHYRETERSFYLAHRQTCFGSYRKSSSQIDAAVHILHNPLLRMPLFIEGFGRSSRKGSLLLRVSCLNVDKAGNCTIWCKTYFRRMSNNPLLCATNWSNYQRDWEGKVEYIASVGPIQTYSLIWVKTKSTKTSNDFVGSFFLMGMSSQRDARCNSLSVDVKTFEGLRTAKWIRHGKKRQSDLECSWGKLWR